MGLKPTPQSRSPVLTADFFTNTHRFSANVAVGNRRFTDVLNDRMSNFLEVKNVYVSHIDKPGEILGTYKLASLIKKHLTFIVIAGEAGGLPQKHKFKPTTKKTEDVFLSISSFEIHGKLEIIGKFDLKAILAVGTTTFMPILQGEAISVHHPGVTFAGPIILVNKVAVEFFSAVKHG